MKASHNNAAGRVGYVRAVFSERARGFAAPVDLVRVVCRVAGRVAMRQRIGDAFRGYLVSESGRVLSVFAEGREKYQWPVYSYAVTSPNSGGYCLGLHCGAMWSFPIDAPDLMAAGSMVAGDWPAVVVRGGGAA